MSILAIDPGSTTGLCWSPHTREANYWLGETPHIEFQDALPSFTGIEVIVLESFIIDAHTHKKTREGIQDTIDTIGAVKYIARKNGWRTVLQAPGERLRISDDELKEWGLWMKGGGGHANQAAKHMALFEIKAGLRR